MSKVFKLDLAVYLTLDTDWSPEEGDLVQRDKTEIEGRVIRLLSRHYPAVDAEVMDVRVEEE